MIVMSKGLAILTGTGDLHLGGKTNYLNQSQSIEGEAILYNFVILCLASPFL
jgi:hypothetical protein